MNRVSDTGVELCKERSWPPHACEPSPVPHLKAIAEATWPPGPGPAHSPSESNTDCGWEKPAGQGDHLPLQFILFLELPSSGCHILM